MNFEKIDKKIYPWQVSTLKELNSYLEEVRELKEKITEDNLLYNSFCDGIETMMKNNEDKGEKRKVFLEKLKNICNEFGYADGVEIIKSELEKV